MQLVVWDQKAFRLSDEQEFKFYIMLGDSLRAKYPTLEFYVEQD